jgi:AraC family transcriptional regulator
MDREDAVYAVSRMQEFIEAHIYEKITLRQLADAAGYSPWHSARIFRELTGHAPFDYIRLLRLTKAALVLRDGKPRVIDVALDFVFDTHEGFTRAFSREFGIPPRKYCVNTPPIQLFMPTKILDYHRYLTEREKKMTERKEKKTVFVQVVERPARKVLIKRGVKAEDYFEYCEEVGCEVWAMLTSVKEALYEPIGMWLPEHLISEGTSKYIQGVELPLDYSNEIPEGYELIELPPCRMMVFQGEPYDDNDFMTEIEDIWDTIEKFDTTLYGFERAPEDAPRFQLVPMGYRGYIEAIPVREIKNK